jgi:hypothetical protein
MVLALAEFSVPSRGDVLVRTVALCVDVGECPKLRSSLFTADDP